MSNITQKIVSTTEVTIYCPSCRRSPKYIYKGSRVFDNHDIHLMLEANGYEYRNSIKDYVCGQCAASGEQLPLLPLGNTGVTS